MSDKLETAALKWGIVLNIKPRAVALSQGIDEDLEIAIESIARWPFQIHWLNSGKLLIVFCESRPTVNKFDISQKIYNSAGECLLPTVVGVQSFKDYRKVDIV